MAGAALGGPCDPAPRGTEDDFVRRWRDSCLVFFGLRCSGGFHRSLYVLSSGARKTATPCNEATTDVTAFREDCCYFWGEGALRPFQRLFNSAMLKTLAFKRTLGLVAQHCSANGWW